MAIIQFTKNQPIEGETIGLYPDMFVTDKKKRTDNYVKTIMDYFYDEAIRQFVTNTDLFAHNYQFVKGKLRPQDFYENNTVTEFTLELLEDAKLPDHVQQYSIFNQPLNTMCGEASTRPDNSRVKAFDDDSQSEELQYKTDMLYQYIIGIVQQKIVEKAAQQGVDITTEEGQQMVSKMSEEELQDKLTSYTSQAEKWGNRMLENLKMQFNSKEEFEMGFRDLLIAGREYYHIYEDRSKFGFKFESVNPRNVWKKKSPNKKYTRDAYASGIIDIMEISEIIEKFSITKKEIDHLRDKCNENYLLKGKPSTLFNGKVGIDSIAYNPYYEGKREELINNEPKLFSNPLELNIDKLSSTGMVGQSFVVLRSYWLDKKKVGKLTYIDEEGEEQITLVDENYTSGAHPNQVELEWGWENQWWTGYKIGPDIYYTEPLQILDYCPIIGVDFENRNSDIKSLIDLLKPYQILFNIMMNQVFEIAQKDLGMQYLMNWRKIPGAKDGELEDALDNMIFTAKELGITFEDDSPENMKAPTANQSQTRPLDLSRVNEMQGRLNMCLQIQQFANGLVGINNERLGGIAATQTASGTQAALAASYSQTQNWFVQHEYIQNQVYQALLDAAQYVESNKPTSTISFVSGTGEHAFIQINGSELKLPDLRVFVTSREKDQQIFNEMKQFLQPFLQNGGSLYDAASFLINDSVRDMQDTLKKDKIRRQQLEDQAQQNQQAQLQSQQQIAQMQLEAQQKRDEAERQLKIYLQQLENDSRERIAAINTYARQDNNADNDGNGIPDVLELVRDQREQIALNQNYQATQMKLSNEAQKNQQKVSNDAKRLELDQKKADQDYELKNKELDVKKKQIDAQVKIAATNRNSFDK